MSVQPPCPSPFARLIAREDLSDAEVTALLDSMVRRERVTLAAMLGYLGLLVERKLYAPAGYDCVSAYLVDRFGWSLPSAQKRLQAAGLCRRFPALLDLVASGAFHLTGLCVLAPVVTELNVERVCAEAQGLTRVQLSEYVRTLKAESQLSATPATRPIPTQIALPLDTATQAPTPVVSEQPPEMAISSSSTEAAQSRAIASAPAPIADSPSSAWTSRLTIHATQALRAKLRHAQALLSHVRGTRNVAVVVERALDLLIATELKRRYGSPARARRKSAVHKPNPGRTRARDYIAVSTRSEVYVRDEGRCTFIGEDGHVCGSTYLLQLHHRLPWAKGGPNTPENLTLHCFTHNQLEAEREGLSRRDSPRASSN
ncbi:MAG: HNH endonuclease [Myxococcales bacterium]|nr:HNH endonuclease [Myxococcales bacterium]